MIKFQKLFSADLIKMKLSSITLSSVLLIEENGQKSSAKTSAAMGSAETCRPFERHYVNEAKVVGKE